MFAYDRKIQESPHKNLTGNKYLMRGVNRMVNIPDYWQLSKSEFVQCATFTKWKRLAEICEACLATTQSYLTLHEEYVQSLKKVVVRDQNISHHTEVLNSCARAFEPMCRAHNVFNDFVTDECSPLPPVSDFTKLQILMEIVDPMNLMLLPEYLGEFDVLFTSLSYKPQQDL